MSPERQGSLAGAILAGGQSTRMGRPKEGIILHDGRPMGLHVYTSLRATTSRVVIAGGCFGWTPPQEATILPDHFPGMGPVAGLDAVLQSDMADVYLMASCDQPLLTPALLGRLASQAGELCSGVLFLRTSSCIDMDPFPMLIHSSMRDIVRSALEEKRLALRRLLAPHARWIVVEDDSLPLVQSMNTAEDLRGCGLME